MPVSEEMAVLASRVGAARRDTVGRCRARSPVRRPRMPLGCHGPSAAGRTARLRLAGQPNRPSYRTLERAALFLWRNPGPRASWGEEDPAEARWAVAQLVENCRADQSPEPVSRHLAEQFT
jgi:hypothetical protein